MKTLDQWLEDSDEEEEEEEVPNSYGSDGGRSSASRGFSTTRTSGAASLIGSHLSAHTPTTTRPSEHPPGGLYAQQEETREKMRRLLGADAVVKATTPTSSTAAGGSASWPISAPPDRSHFSFGTSSAAGPSQGVARGTGTPPSLGADTAPGSGSDGAATAARVTPGSHPRVTRTDTATDSSQLPEVEQTMAGFTVGGPAYEAVEVMVVDRGTQTVTSEGTQTDPLPIQAGPFYTGPIHPIPALSYSGAGAFRGGGVAAAPPALGFGVDGRPYRQYLYDYEKHEAAEAAKLREQLGMIQNSIDMLIARYNLPPPPL